MKKYWWEDLDKSELAKLSYIKEIDVIRPLYKLLVIIYLGYTRSDALKDLLGGNYIVLIKEGASRGLILYERGKPPKLTEKGERIARLTLEYLEKLRGLT